MKTKLIVVVATTLLSAPLMADRHADREHPGKRMKQMFERLDSDGNGSISADEFNMPSDRPSPEMRMDTNGDGVLTRDEVIAVSEQRSAEALERFDSVDTDGNGAIDNDERRLSLFNRMDADGDGALTKREVMKSRRGGRDRADGGPRMRSKDHGRRDDDS